jgi:hypothetical protein
MPTGTAGPSDTIFKVSSRVVSQKIKSRSVYSIHNPRFIAGLDSYSARWMKVSGILESGDL